MLVHRRPESSELLLELLEERRRTGRLLFHRPQLQLRLPLQLASSLAVFGLSLNHLNFKS